MGERLESILLDHYHCTFFLPLLGFGEGVPEPKGRLRKTYPYDQALEDMDAEAFYYFTPTLRDIVFDRGVENGLTPVREWHLPPSIDNWRLELLPTGEQQKEIDEGKLDQALVHQEVCFQAVSLYRYFNGIYLLAFRVQPTALQGMSGVPTCWRQVANDPHREAYQKLQLEAWLRFTRLGRQLYPTFTEQWSEKKIAALKLTIPGEPPINALYKEVPKEIPRFSEHLSPIIVRLVGEFFDQPIADTLKRDIRLFDDRMFVSVAYGLAGAKHTEDVLGRIKALMATTDRFADTFDDFGGYAYDPRAVGGYLEGTEFGFWAGMGGHYVFNDMVNAYLYNGWFFRSVIAPKHIPCLYDRMLIQALFYQASLRHYDHRITQSTSDLLGEKQGKQGSDPINQILGQRKEFIQFTNQYWFRELTNQMQGKEICRLQQSGLGIEGHYGLLQDEISRTNDYLQVLNENRANEEANRLAVEANKAGKRATQFSQIAAVLAVVAALPVLNDIFKTEPSMWATLVDWGVMVSGAPALGIRLWLVAVLVVLVVLVLGEIFRHGKD